MPFLNVDDNFADHKKVWPLSDRAFRLHVAGMCYCSRLETDGFVPADKVRGLVPKYTKAALDELIAADRWRAIGIDTVVSYEVVNYLEWNLSAVQIKARKEAAAKRKAKWIQDHRNGAHDDE